MDYIDLTTSNNNDFDPTNENDRITSSDISFGLLTAMRHF